MCLTAVEIYICFLCLLGGEVSTQFDLMFYSSYEISWNEFPLESQKLFKMMIINAQKPVYIQGYMNTQCTHEILKKVRLVYDPCFENLKCDPFLSN